MKLPDMTGKSIAVPIRPTQMVSALAPDLGMRGFANTAKVAYESAVPIPFSKHYALLCITSFEAYAISVPSAPEILG